MRVLGRRETLNEHLAREAGLGPQRERRRPVRGVLTHLGRFVTTFPLWAWRARRKQRKLAQYTEERDYLSRQEAARERAEFGLKMPRADEPPHYGG